MWGMKHFDYNLTEIVIRVNKFERETLELKEDPG